MEQGPVSAENRIYRQVLQLLPLSARIGLKLPLGTHMSKLLTSSFWDFLKTVCGEILTFSFPLTSRQELFL